MYRWGKHVVAAGGFRDMVTGPTTILAGERGPEHVQITPQGSGFQGGGANGRQVVINFAVTVNSLDPRGMRELVQGELGDLIVQRLRASSLSGETVVYSRGVTVPRTV